MIWLFFSSLLFLLSGPVISYEFDETTAPTTLGPDDDGDPSPTTTTEEPKYERIITNLIDVLIGVPVDYSYNDTSIPPPGGFSSAPGCPKNDHGYPWLQYRPLTMLSSLNILNRCFLAGSRGPCDWGQKIFAESGSSGSTGSPYGYCNCECLEGWNIQRSNNKEVFCRIRNDQLHFATFKQVFLSEVKRCYSLYDQGPCKVNEWLVEVNKTDAGTAKEAESLTKCEERRCPMGQLPKNSPAKDDVNKVECIFPEYVDGYTLFGGSGGGASSAVSKNGCRGNQVYSKLLRKCVDTTFSFVF